MSNPRTARCTLLPNLELRNAVNGQNARAVRKPANNHSLKKLDGPLTLYGLGISWAKIPGIHRTALS
jgi:hypothetical protein